LPFSILLIFTQNWTKYYDKGDRFPVITFRMSCGVIKLPLSNFTDGFMLNNLNSLSSY